MFGSGFGKLGSAIFIPFLPFPPAGFGGEIQIGIEVENDTETETGRWTLEFGGGIQKLESESESESGLERESRV